MKMAAGLLLRRAAGMEDGGAFGGRKRSQFQFLERARRHGGNLRPVFDSLRRNFPRLADFAVGEVVLELERKQFQRQRREIGNRKSEIGNHSAQAHGETG